MQCKQSSNVHLDSILHRSVTADPSAHSHCILFDGVVRHSSTAEECVLVRHGGSRETMGRPAKQAVLSGEAAAGCESAASTETSASLRLSGWQALIGALVPVLWMDVVAMDPDLADLA